MVNKCFHLSFRILRFRLYEERAVNNSKGTAKLTFVKHQRGHTPATKTQDFKRWNLYFALNFALVSKRPPWQSLQLSCLVGFVEWYLRPLPERLSLRRQAQILDVMH